MGSPSFHPSPVGEGKKQRSRNPGKPSATRGNLTSFEGDIDYERRGTPEILRTEGLSKFFPGVKALDNVNFSLRRGEIMALLGENGAGKSTLIKALTGVYHADRGTIWLEGGLFRPKIPPMPSSWGSAPSTVK